MHHGHPRLVLVIGSLEGGGAERQLANMASYWAAQGVDVTVATWTGPEIADFHSLDGRVHRAHLSAQRAGGDLPGSLQASARRLRNLRRLLVSSRPSAMADAVEYSLEVACKTLLKIHEGHEETRRMTLCVLRVLRGSNFHPFWWVMAHDISFVIRKQWAVSSLPLLSFLIPTIHCLLLTAHSLRKIPQPIRPLY